MKNALKYLAVAFALSVGPTVTVAQAVDTTAVERASALATSLVSAGQAAESASRGFSPAKTEEQVLADVVAALGDVVAASTASGASANDLLAGITKAAQTSGISPTLSKALGIVKAQIEALIDPTQAINQNVDASLPAPPPAPQPGAGYRG